MIRKTAYEFKVGRGTSAMTTSQRHASASKACATRTLFIVNLSLTISLYIPRFCPPIAYLMTAHNNHLAHETTMSIYIHSLHLIREFRNFAVPSLDLSTFPYPPAPPPPLPASPPPQTFNQDNLPRPTDLENRARALRGGKGGGGRRAGLWREGGGRGRDEKEDRQGEERKGGKGKGGGKGVSRWRWHIRCSVRVCVRAALAPAQLPGFLSWHTLHGGNIVVQLVVATSGN